MSKDYGYKYTTYKSRSQAFHRIFLKHKHKLLTALLLPKRILSIFVQTIG